MKPYHYILLLALFTFHCQPEKEESATTQFPGKPAVPPSIKKEHEDLLGQIQKLTTLKDSAGLAAGKLYDLLQHHFAEEEDFALPQLGLLPLLAYGKPIDQSNEVIKLSEKLNSNLSHLNVEHQLIKAYVDELKRTATKEALPEIIQFEKELKRHANSEEDVQFPTAVLIGKYLNLETK